MIKKYLDRLRKNPFYYTAGINIETTNYCNYAPFHKKCAANLCKERHVLSLEKIEKILVEVGHYDFGGMIYPFLYSEPLTDPRMFKIFEMIKKYVPKAKIQLYTNGAMLDETLMFELDRFVDRLNISVYSPEEGKHFHKL